MAYLPHFDPADLTTKSDIAVVKTHGLDSDLKPEITEVRDGLATFIGLIRIG